MRHAGARGQDSKEHGGHTWVESGGDLGEEAGLAQSAYDAQEYTEAIEFGGLAGAKKLRGQSDESMKTGISPRAYGVVG